MRAIVSGAVAGLLVGTMIVGPLRPGAVRTSHAQPAPDLERAKDLYAGAEAAMADGRYADAVRDYSAAHALTKDPALLFKLGSANEKAGACDAAVIYFQRYLKEGQPDAHHVALTQDRIAACAGDPAGSASGSAAIPEAGSAGSAAPVPGAGSAAPVPAGGSAAPEAGSAAPVPGAGSAAPGAGSAGAGSAARTGAGSAAREDASSAGTAAPGEGSPTPAPVVLGKDRAAWLLVGGSLAFVTVGAVLAYQAEASENDIDDLYVGFGGMPPEFDERTRRRYDALLAEGQRYERFSWISFGLAGALGIGAAVLFYRGRDETTTVTPVVNQTGAGVAATVRF